MDKSEAALGARLAPNTCATIDPASLNSRERIFLLEEQMHHMQRVIMRMKKEQAGTAPAQTLPASAAINANKDGIPVGTMCFGATEKSPFLYYLTVGVDGYVVGSTKFASLSAAAEAVSLVRRSGWTFWRLLDGRSLKEVYRA